MRADRKFVSLYWPTDFVLSGAPAPARIADALADAAD